MSIHPEKPVTKRIISKADVEILRKFFAEVEPFRVHPNREDDRFYVDGESCFDGERYVVEDLLEEGYVVTDEVLFSEIGRAFGAYYTRAPLQEHIPRFYWIIKECLVSSSFMEKFDDISRMSRKDSEEIRGALNLIKAVEHQKITITINCGPRSAPLTNQSLVKSFISEIRKFDGRFTDPETGTDILKAKSNFDLENRNRLCRELQAYLTDVVLINRKQDKYLIIALIFSLGGRPFNQIVEGKSIPVSHNDDAIFDPKKQSETVKTILKTPVA